METIPKDVLIKIALELDYIDILRWCVSNKYVNEKVCKNTNFWRDLLYKDYPFISRFNSDFDKSQNFKNLYKLLRETIVSPNPFNKPIYISDNMKNFLSNTNFGSYGSVNINDILKLTLDKNILSLPALTTLITYYLRKNKGNETFFRIDEHMDKYLGENLDFNKDRFQSNKVRNIVSLNILKGGNKEILQEYKELVNKITAIIDNFFKLG